MAPAKSCAGTLLAASTLLSTPSASLAQTAHRTPAAQTPHFAIHNDFDTNLNDALIAVGVARKFRRDELFRAGPELACFEKLPLSTRFGWERATDYYAVIVSPGEFNRREQYLLRAQLAGFDQENVKAEDQVYVEIAKGMRAAAGPAYAACRWPEQEKKNRAWTLELQKQLAEHASKVAPRLEQLYKKSWKTPIPLDIVETVSWAGANSIIVGPGAGHLLIGASNDKKAALELAFHEASHLLMDRGDPLPKALDNAAKQAGFKMPNDLWHVVMFFTTGEVVKKTFADAGQPGYTPMVYEIFGRSPWGKYRNALETAWRPYTTGERTLDEAANSLIEILSKP